MSRDEILAKHFHELMGLAMDGAVNHRAGAELSIWFRRLQEKVRERILAIIDDAQPKPAPVNGQAVQTQVKR